jgi:mRNA interferase MazF
MTSLSNKDRQYPHPWEVWLAYLRFADHPDIGKVRPVVIIDSSTSSIVVAKVTTAKPQKNFRYGELINWKVEGLLRPSRVQTLPLFRLTDTDLLGDCPLGILTKRDRIALQVALDMPDGPTDSL